MLVSMYVPLTASEVAASSQRHHSDLQGMTGIDVSIVLMSVRGLPYRSVVCSRGYQRSCA
jgi:hypothetical protein